MITDFLLPFYYGSRSSPIRQIDFRQISVHLICKVFGTDPTLPSKPKLAKTLHLTPPDHLANKALNSFLDWSMTFRSCWSRTKWEPELRGLKTKHGYFDLPNQALNSGSQLVLDQSNVVKDQLRAWI